MYFSTLLAILALLGLNQATDILPTTMTCTKLSTDCEVACGTGYKSCGSDECYNPDKLESCCAPNLTCPSGSYCNPEGKGCSVPSSSPPRGNCTTVSSSGSDCSSGGYSFSGTSSAITSLSFTNGTITSASAPGNISLPVTAISPNNATKTPSSTTSLVSGISAGTPSSNFTYSTTKPPTTTTLAAPANTGGGNVARAGGVGLLVIIGAAVGGWL